MTTPSKRKSNKSNRWVTIKGWAEQNSAGYWVFAEQGYETLQFPAELRVKAKYIKEEK